MNAASLGSGSRHQQFNGVCKPSTVPKHRTSFSQRRNEP